MKRNYKCLYCFLILILTACSSKKEEEVSKYKLYYINKDETQVVSEAFTPESEEKEALVEEFISALSSEPENKKYLKVLPDEVEILDYSFGEAKQIILNFSTTYNIALTGIREILTRAAIVKTFGQIEGIEYIDFTVNGQPLMLSGDVPITMMKTSDFVEMTSFTQNAYVTIYFSNKEGNGLIEANRSVDYDGVISVEELIIEQLIAGPVEGEVGMRPTLPEDTVLNSVTTKDGICYVDFNEGFLNKLSDVSEKVTIYSVVNSLVEQANINKVQFLINGEKRKLYQTEAFDIIFERDLNIIKSEN